MSSYPDAGETRADWWREAVFYQIYPRSFQDSNGDGIGDLAGIAQRLEHVASLGVDAIWISPFYPSPMKDFGYDVVNYCDVDPIFGTLGQWDALLDRAHGLGLKVIIDQVWSHTSDRHPWFLESAASSENPKANWYVWADAKPDGSPPNNWQASFGGASWTWHPSRRQYYLHNFLREQPDLNFWNPQVREAVLEVARFWLDRGVDGFRLDVINYIFHDALLSDNPSAALTRTPLTATQMQSHIFDRSRPEALDFVAELRSFVDKYPGRVLIGEVVDAQALERQKQYTLPGRALHTAYSFFLLRAGRGNAQLFRDALGAWGEGEGWPTWSLGNHDVPRFPSRLTRSSDPANVKALLSVLLTMRGTPILYQGDELGLPQAELDFDDLRDPFAINAFDGGAGRDGARTPMVWDADANNAGFTDAKHTWLPISPGHLPLAVSRQSADPQSILSHTIRMITLRRQHAALRSGRLELIDLKENVLAFVRYDECDALLCVFELAGEAATVELERNWGPVALFSQDCALRAYGRLEFAPFGHAVYRLASYDPMPLEKE